MDLNQINEQLKVMQQQIAIMQESVSNMLLSSNAPVKYANLAALQRQITYMLEQFAIAVNGNEKVDMTNTYQEIYI